MTMDVMLDLETMGTAPDAPILAIGAVQFNSERLGGEFYATVDFEDAVTSVGAVLSPSTVKWWMGQSDEARTAAMKGTTPLLTALSRFSAWLPEDAKVWGCGAGFDNVLLADTYRRAKLPQPWKFWNDRCYRTLKAMRPDIAVARTGTHHDALDDAKTQAEHAIRILAALRGAQ